MVDRLHPYRFRYRELNILASAEKTIWHAGFRVSVIFKFSSNYWKKKEEEHIQFFFRFNIFLPVSIKFSKILSFECLQIKLNDRDNQRIINYSNVS